jgi:hypothetical protein
MAGRGRVLRKKTIAFLLLLAFAGEAVHPSAAPAGNVAEELAEIAAAEAAVWLAEYLILGALKEQIKTETTRVETQAAYYVFMVDRDKRIEREYQEDHSQLQDKAWQSSLAELTALYAALAFSGATSFGPTVDETKFKADNPGYVKLSDDLASSDVINFADRYQKRMESAQTYVDGIFTANILDAQNVVSAQSLIADLQKSSLSADKYHPLMKAGIQITDVSSRETENLRSGVARQMEARVQLALNERQERLDELAAFEQAVLKWKDQQAGASY